MSNSFREKEKQYTQDFLYFKKYFLDTFDSLIREYGKLKNSDGVMDVESKILALERAAIGFTSLEEYERACIYLALKLTRGNVSEAIKIVKVSRGTMQRYINRFDIPVKEFRQIKKDKP